MSDRYRKELLMIICAEVTDTYSSTMRAINKDNPKKLQQFMKTFKDAFDSALNNDEEYHQDVALEEAKNANNCNLSYKFMKLAQLSISAQENPDFVGRNLASIIKILLSKVPHDKAAAYENMRSKILNMSAAEITNINMPITAAYGQALTLLKTTLNGYQPGYITNVLASTARHLY